MNIEQIERLRAAAQEHGEVSDLLDALAASFPFFADGNREFQGSKLDAEHLQSALIAAKFAEYDRGCNGPAA